MLKMCFGQMLSDLRTITQKFRTRDFCFFLCLASFFLFSFIYVNFLALVDVGNVCFLLFCASVLITCLFRHRFPINIGSIGLALFICLVLFINLAKGVFSLSPLVPPLAMLFVYIFLSILDVCEKRAVVRAFYVCLLFLLLFASAKYLPGFFKTGIFIRSYDGFFGNLDGLTDYFAILFGLTLYYLLKKEVVQIPICIWCLLFIGISERRTALILCFVSVLVFVYCLIPRNRKILFMIICPLFVLMGFLAILFVPVFGGVRERLFKAVSGFFSYSAAYAGDPRGNIILRGLYYCFSNFFGGYGYDQIVIRYGNEAAHDLLGDLSLNYSGFFAIIYILFFSAAALKMLRKPGDDSFIPKFLALYYFLFIVLGTFVYNRPMCIAAGIAAGFLNTYQTNFSQIRPILRESVSL